MSYKVKTLSGGLELTFRAAVHSVLTGAEEHLATFYIMNTSRNRNKWGVTDKALTEALPALIGKQIGCGPGHKIDDHYPNPLKVGRWVKVEKPNGYALGTAEITDDYVWEKLNAGKWGPISVVINSYRETCSKCGEDITKDPWSHGHVKDGSGYVVIESFAFDRVDFIDDPAYPQAGLLNMGAAAWQVQAPLVLLASYYEGFAKAPEDTSWSLSRADYTIEQLKRASAVVTGDGDKKEDCRLPHHTPDGTLVWHGVDAAGKALEGARDGVKLSTGDAARARAHLTPHYHAFDKRAPWESSSNVDGLPGAQGDLNNPDGKNRRQQAMEELDKIKLELETLKAEHETMKTAKADLEAKLKASEEAATDPEKNPELKALKAKVEKMEADAHRKLVDAAVEARFAAGLATDKAVEAEALKSFNDATLTLLAREAEKVAEILAKAEPTGPKAKYNTKTATALEEAIENERMRLYGHRKEAKE